MFAIYKTEMFCLSTGNNFYKNLQNGNKSNSFILPMPFSIFYETEQSAEDSVTTAVLNRLLKPGNLENKISTSNRIGI